MDSIQLAPYNDTMRLGQGYNSFLQLPCLDGAVKIHESGIQTHVARPDPSASVSQVVSYSSRFVERISDVARGMNVSAASSIKSGTIGISGNSLSVDEAKFADSDLNAIISVKVINQTTTINKNPEFSGLDRKMKMTNETFFQTFGDCYISGNSHSFNYICICIDRPVEGFVEGGDLHGIISIKAPDATKKANIEAALKGVMNGPASEFKLSEGLASSALEAALRDTETTITVNWSGGAQIKPDGEEWTLESLLRAASGFPARVATCPERTWAVLTPYTQNQSFVKWAAESKIYVPTFSHIEQYTHDLLDSYMLYKRHLVLLQTAMGNPLAFRESKCDNHIPLDVHSLVETRKDIKREMAKIVGIIDSLNQDPNGIITTEIESAEKWAARLPLLGN
ncbi:hypothetical protein M431DRAFT_118887 [Trichoderma harzianum CBS 226.95]|uniref:Uncharacterized protein n=1 Tax=Trichoderma harzianum CBS 226.95 TaxID=983964 RepID=A0A2T4A833_TRIHA|nr:hypothetical protein M431DRAFT_118887 [Trichoderma harzianum CBS 226.95]PTB53234.1 hypothetical protein M431DRAFT_118887 [Trichoderma harzianum CBS 226.95]